MASDKDLRGEVAELTEAVRELRDRAVADEIRELRDEIARLRQEKTAHSCHDCHCGHVCWHFYGGPRYQPYTPLPYTTTSGTITVSSGSTYTGNTTTLSLGN